MKTKILKFIITILTIFLIFLIFKIIDLINQGNFINPYVMIDNHLIVSSFIVVFSLILTFYFFFKKEEKPTPFGKKFVRNDEFKIDNNSSKNQKTLNAFPQEKNKLSKLLVLKLISLASIILYSIQYLTIYNSIFVDSFIKGFLIFCVGVSIIMSIGLYYNKKWGWIVAFYFSLTQFLWFPVGTIFGLILCIACLCSIPRTDKFNWNDYKLKRRQVKKIKMNNNIQFIEKILRDKK
tara:strand:- start:2907 stop:3614 length:708 start_codon:yes stop_codon:yes gene_type:complete